MCGIFGYIGKRQNAAKIVLEGLKLLEYRGYDSWGIAVKSGKRIKLEKHVGQIGDATTDLPKSGLGIGHTRWATHGGVTVENAHPHLDCTRKIALMHNGIIENFEEIKTELVKKGHKIISDVDTEVAVHLIEEYYKTSDFVTATLKAFRQFKGLNAIVVENCDTNEIIAAKNGSPLIIGKGKNEYFVASDASGIIKHTKTVFFLEDDQLAVISDELKILDIKSGKTVKPKFTKLNWEFEDTQKGNFKHYILKEIFEQPHVLENIALNYSDQTEKLAWLIQRSYGAYFLGCGSASYAALLGTYLFSKVANRHLNFSIGSEFNYLEGYLTEKSLLIPISQSGETIDVVEPVIKARLRGVKVAAITNVLGSTLYRNADFKILLNAGIEKAVVATKSFTAMISVLLLTAYALAGRTNEGRELLLKASENVSEILRDGFLKQIKDVAGMIKDQEHIYVLGRGLSYPVALETSLKIKETACVHAEGFAGGELKHGVIALVEKSTLCIVIAPNDETYNDIISNAQEVKARGALVLGIGPRKDKAFDLYLKTRDIKEATTIPQVVIAQLLAYNLALTRGIKDPDKPRNLAKSVTVK